MSDPVEYVASNGHAVLLDSADWIALRPMLEAGVRLQSVAERGAPKVILREHARGQKPQRTMLLSKVLLGANESQCIRMLNGPLDHRRESLRVVEDGRRSGWASHVHAQMRAGDSVVCVPRSAEGTETVIPFCAKRSLTYDVL